MNMPTKAQMQVVIDNLISILPLASHEEALNMGELYVKETSYGTVACLGGWYAIAKKLNSPDTKLYFGYGAQALVKDLGLEHMGLICWASTHPSIWGNIYGGSIFGSPIAYQSEKRPFGAKSLADIVEHFKEVQSRLSI